MHSYLIVHTNFDQLLGKWSFLFGIVQIFLPEEIEPGIMKHLKVKNICIIPFSSPIMKPLHTDLLEHSRYKFSLYLDSSSLFSLQYYETFSYRPY